MKKGDPKPRDSINGPKSHTVKAREANCISLAYDLAEERLRDGTATAQEVVHFLKLGSLREKKEMQLLEMKEKLMKTQIEAAESAKRMEALYEDGMRAITSYRSPVMMGAMESEQIE